MHVFPAINSVGDKPFWVSRIVFRDRFDQADFSNRDVKDVIQAYLDDWFYWSDDGDRMFYLPVVGAIGRRTDLIGSRHRLAVLLPHLEELPFAFAFAHLTEESLAFLESIPKRPLDVTHRMWLPDLPFRKKLP
jgi:hypothetical protein